jgi:hypothetical protein
MRSHVLARGVDIQRTLSPKLRFTTVQSLLVFFENRKNNLHGIFEFRVSYEQI